MNAIERRFLGTARSRLIVGGSLLIAVGVAAYTFASGHQPEAVRPHNAVGDQTCLSCHEQKAAYERTAHRLTSTVPTAESMLGNFTHGENVLRTANPDLSFRMDSTADGYYQTAVFGQPPDTTVRSERIAYVTGLRKGQSYLYWTDDRLYQLPISYWENLGWANSPGYPDGRAYFDRPIVPRCLECHATWFESMSDSIPFNRYRQDTAILGISCETCHGAGEEHDRRERSPLRALLPPGIINPAELPRARQVDGCALCHGGTAPLRTAPFSYVPGQPLEKQTGVWTSPDTGRVDVHGNQVALLERSRCYTLSQMTCATCHDVHQEERDVMALSDKCFTCHTVQSCGLFPTEGEALVGRCVDCHMPNLWSNTVISDHLGREERVRVRTHWIRVYPELQPP